MRLTPHFWLHEFHQKPRHGFQLVEYPASWVEARLSLLCEVLEGVRYALGETPVKVTSGYRSPAYNRSVGGARRSQHVEGRAADIVAEGKTSQEVHDCILQMYRSGQIFIGGLGLYPNFVHVDVRPSKRLHRWKGR